MAKGCQVQRAKVRACMAAGEHFWVYPFHWQHYANVPNMYFGIPKDEHERDLASLMGASHIKHAQ